MCAVLVLVDREHGRSTSITLYQDQRVWTTAASGAATLGPTMGAAGGPAPSPDDEGARCRHRHPVPRRWAGLAEV